MIQHDPTTGSAGSKLKIQQNHAKPAPVTTLDTSFSSTRCAHSEKVRHRVRRWSPGSFIGQASWQFEIWPWSLSDSSRFSKKHGAHAAKTRCFHSGGRNGIYWNQWDQQDLQHNRRNVGRKRGKERERQPTSAFRSKYRFVKPLKVTRSQSFMPQGSAFHSILSHGWHSFSIRTELPMRHCPWCRVDIVTSYSVMCQNVGAGRHQGNVRHEADPLDWYWIDHARC